MQKDNRPMTEKHSPYDASRRAGGPPASADSRAEPLLHRGEGVWAGAPMATRREFAAAASATIAAFAAGIPLAREARAEEDTSDSDASQADEPVDEAPTGIDDDGNVDIITAFEDLIEQVDYAPQATYMLPTGCNVCADCETCAAVVQASGGGRPFTVVGCLDYATGEYTVVVPEPVGGTDCAPSDARITDALIAWVEVDNSTDCWAFYAAPFSGAPVGVGTYGLVKLAEGDAEWLPPQFDVSGSTVVWQVMPDPYGSHTAEYSHAYLWTLGASEGVEVYESPGRFACEPNISGGVLTLAPRIKPDEGVYYGLKAIDLDHGRTVVDEQEMPVSVRPFRATRIGDVFAFSVEANYGYGGLLGSMGYYIGPGGGPFDYLSREPSAQVCYVGGCYIIKSQLSYFVVNLERRTFARIAAASGCVDYGDYPATAGTASQFVTYATVKDSTTGIPNGVLVRIFTLL